MKFAQLFNPNDPVFSVDGYPSTLFPANFPAEIESQIKSEFEDYDIAISPPWRWVQRFHLVLDRHLYQWQKLIASERFLRDDDGIYNYDLTEESSTSGEHSEESQNQAQGQNDQFVSDTPDGSLQDISHYMSSGSRDSGTSSGSGSTSGTSESESTLRRYGNIGVMTSAQILGGYREATNYDAYQTIFREIEFLFVGSFDLDDNGSLDVVVNPIPFGGV